MKNTAIICEYNPMTNGHVYHIAKAREETECDSIICVMSGSFTQRGDACIVDKHTRAAAAIRNGVDMVVELPVIYAISPADNFAYGAIKTVAVLPDIEYLSFGSECGDASLLEKISDLIINEPEEISQNIQKFLQEGLSFPKARALSLDLYGKNHEEFKDIVGILDKPNNILGIAYIVQIKKQGLNIKIHTIKREGADYNNDTFDEKLASSSAIRRAIKFGDYEKIRSAVPIHVYNYLLNIKPTSESLNEMMLYKMQTISGYDLEHYYDISGGLHNRLKIAAYYAKSLEELLENAKCKSITMARLKRICLYCFFDIKKETYQHAVDSPAYVQILAISYRRKDLLSALSASCKNVLERYSHVNRVDKTLRKLIKLDFSAEGLLDIINHSDVFVRKMVIE